MTNKKKIHKMFLEILSCVDLNWENKAKLIQEIIETNPEADKIYLELITKHSSRSTRKSAASIINYFNKADFSIELVYHIFNETEWSVRFAIAKALAKHFNSRVIDELRLHYNSLIKDKDEHKKNQYKMIFAEILGALGLPDSLPILVTFLEDIADKRDMFSIEFIRQIIYAIGEVGNESIIFLLLKYSAENPTNPKSIRDSAEHAITKIARKLGFSTKKEILEHLYKKDEKK